MDNLLNRIFNADAGQSGGQYYIIGRVKKVVLGPTISKKPVDIPDVDYTGPQDLGKIRYEILYSTLTTSKSETAFEPAYPMFTLVKQYPVVGEIVFIIPGPTHKLNERSSKKQFFYLPPYSVWGNSNHGAFPNMSELADFLNKYSNRPGYSGTTAYTPTFPLGYTFKEKLVRTLKPFEGDSVIQARFGQSIRFGSTVPERKTQNTWSNSGANGDPITIILNEQKQVAVAGLDKFDPFVENVTRDGSSIWLTSTQEIILPAFPLNSFGVSIDRANEVTIEIERAPISNQFVDPTTQDRNSAQAYQPSVGTTVSGDTSSTNNSSSTYTASGKKYSAAKSYKIEVEVINNKTGQLVTIQGSSSLASIQDAYDKIVKKLNDYKSAQNISFEIPALNALTVSQTNF